MTPGRESPCLGIEEQQEEPPIISPFSFKHVQHNSSVHTLGAPVDSFEMDGPISDMQVARKADQTPRDESLNCLVSLPRILIIDSLVTSVGHVE